MDDSLGDHLLTQGADGESAVLSTILPQGDGASDFQKITLSSPAA